jgi:hypothetical protein
MEDLFKKLYALQRKPKPDTYAGEAFERKTNYAIFCYHQNNDREAL